MRSYITVKEWVINKAQETARRYNTYIDCKRTQDGLIDRTNGVVTVYAEYITAETEKAIQANLRTGEVDGSTEGWTLWIPKSQIIAIEGLN